MYIPGEWTFRTGVKDDLRWNFCLYMCICEGGSLYFPKAHPPSYINRKYGKDQIIFAENEALENGLESSLNGTVGGGKVDFIGFYYLYHGIYESRSFTFVSKAHALSSMYSKVGNDQIYIHGVLTSGNLP